MAKSSELQDSVELLAEMEHISSRPGRMWYTAFWQLVRFGIVGAINTIIDVIALNLLLWRLPTHNANLLLVYNSVAYILGASNSYMLNKYWTFRQRQRPTGGELSRFMLVNVVGVFCNDGLIWGSARVLHPFIANELLWANAAKGVAVVGTAAISFLGMRLWVFAGAPRVARKQAVRARLAASELELEGRRVSATEGKKVQLAQSLSVIMPAHNEEVAIASTVRSVLSAVSAWTENFEVIVVNDGSKDRTREILEEIAEVEPRVRVITHEVNQGYGAALVSGFEAIQKDLAFFMDSDGQFDICDLERFFPLIEKYDAVLGYRIDRQDTWMRKLNAWGWKMLVSAVFRLQVRDVDCAFKLYRAQFFHEHRLETRGAMINTEILYKFRRAGYTYTQVGVHHLPRRGGRATGAKPEVIARAFRELFVYAWQWHAEEKKVRKQLG